MSSSPLSLLPILGLICLASLLAGAVAPPPPRPVAPVAAFNVPTGPLSIGQNILFGDASTGNPTAWAWKFGDGGTATTRNPTHAFAAAGTFTVTLTAKNTTGSATASRTLTILVAPATSAFTFLPATPTAGASVQFTDASKGNPTAWAWNFGDGTTGTTKSPAHIFAKAGSYTVTLNATNAGGGRPVSKMITVAAAAGGTTTPAFTMAQTISDQAQGTTLAFSALAMMTGNIEAQSFFPPGKVADYTGFQYLRDNDPDGMGHNTSFLTRIANNIIFTLNDSQFAQLKALAVAQQEQIGQYGMKRFPLMQAFRRQLTGTIPTGSIGLDIDAIKQASRELYLIDGQISFDRALLYANILGSLTTTQKAYLAAMKGKGWKSWPDITNTQIQAKMQALPQGTAVAVMTYASDLFSWYAGSVTADVYFCPERHGTYFGSFYIKDAPAIGHEGYGINEQLTATAGAALCDSTKGYVTASQAAQMNSLVATQRNNLYAGATNIVQIRTQIATLLRGLLASTANSAAVRTQVLALSGTYGELDGEDNYNYAMVMSQVYKTLSTDQKTRLTALRKSIMSGTYADGTAFDFSVCTTPFLYSAPLAASAVASYIANTDDLFAFAAPTGLGLRGGMRSFLGCIIAP